MDIFFLNYPNTIEKHINYVNNIYNKSNGSKDNHYFTYNNISYVNDIKNKQANLYYIASLLSNNANVCEIGFNAGHSSILILSASSNINLTIFDIDEHNYSILCLDYIKSVFNNNIDYIEGNSIYTIPLFINNNDIKYDLIHIDGGKNKECIINDMKNANILIKPNGIIIINDTHFEYISDIVDNYIKSNEYEEIQLLELNNISHRIIKKMK